MPNLACQMRAGCQNPVTHIDSKGFVYCAPCGRDRQYSHPCRRLRPWELRLLQRGEQVPCYEPISQSEYLKRKRAAADAESWREYDRAAEDLARRGKAGAIGDALPMDMSAATVRLIDADPEAFEKRVRGFAYAIAMGEIFTEVKQSCGF